MKKKSEAIDKTWLNLANKINQTAKFHFSGPPNNTAKTYVLSQIATPLLNKNRAVFWLCKNDNEALSVCENLKFWQKFAAGFRSQIISENIILLNPSNQTQLSAIPANDCCSHLWRGSVFSRNYQLLKSNHNIVISTLENLQTLPSPDFKKYIVTIKTDDRLSPQTLSKKFTNLGYERNQTADQPGTFAIRGEVVDVWTPQFEKPVRIEFDFGKISSIKKFESASKKIKNQFKKTDIIPLIIPKKIIKQDSNRTMEQYSKTVFIYSDPEIFETGTAEWPDFLKSIKNNQQIIFHSFGTSNSYHLNFKSPPLYHNDLKKFLTDIKKYQEDSQIVIATSKEKEINQLFKEKQINFANFLIAKSFNFQISGFVDQSNKLILFTDTEIFGKTESSTQTKSKSKFATSPLSPVLQKNDHVVHIDHGIAKFLGAAKQKIDGLEKEYFVLEYAKGDKLYVPVELADKIEKYIGLANPKIHRLHESTWHQVKKKIKEQAEKVAKELLDLYAQREIAQTQAFTPKTPEERELENSFPYEETPDQLKTLKDIERDLQQNKPMDRLICGDVGFGKTEVAIRAGFKAVMNGFQVALLCPTTILAQQHYDTFKQRLEKFPVEIEVLSRFKSKAQQKNVVEKTKAGGIDILIGTHRLFSDDIDFKNLGLIIVDEEQRFGVEHKEKLKKLRTQAHILTLTATPIPRTLNFSLAGLRDISVIETPPPGRMSIKTVIKQYNDEDIKTAINNEIKRGGQIYFVYNKIETINFFTRKLKNLLPNVRFGIAHGQMSENELAQTMADFDNRRIDTLVCSTIIENGLDLPNVNTLIVENATKFGLAQLYQLRGRVGRSDRQAYAYFFYRRLHAAVVGIQSLRRENERCENELRENELKRLQALKEAEELGSGLQLAMRDLEIRGVGNILGKKQHGAVSAIGLSLYTRLLSQAVEELKTGIAPPPTPDISIDLPLEIGIPNEFEPNEAKRLQMYQKLANITDSGELKIFRETFAKKSSRSISENIQNLFHFLEIKLLAQQTPISSIGTTFGLKIDGDRKKHLVIKFKQSINPKIFLKLLDINPSWRRSENQIKIDFEDLGKNWISEIKKTTRFLGEKEKI